MKRLPAPNLRGTFARAYSLLTRLVSQIGWDELLTTRSTVFVMEEEYRMQKAQADIMAVVKEGSDGKKGVRESGEEEMGGGGADDDASTRGVASPEDVKKEMEQESGPAIPTIRISSESDREKEVGEEGVVGNGDAADIADAVTAAAEDTLGKPEQAATQEEGEDAAGDAATVNGGEAFSFSNKRLCERWLDNLFMVLYEVCVYGVLLQVGVLG